MAISLAHRGLCVSDPARSARFYAGLGFEEVFRADGVEGDWLDRANGLTGSRVDARMLRNRQGVTLNLVHYARPGGEGPRERRPMTALGLTHLNFYVRDFDAALAAVRDGGGQVIEPTLTESGDGTGGMSMVYCTDPDGIRVEIWSTIPYGPGDFATAVPGVDLKFSHSGICVTDPERSARFYQVLGFERAETFDYCDPPGQLDRMIEAPGTRLFAQMLRSGGEVIELLQFVAPAVTGDGERQPANRFGLSNLVFDVESLDATAAALVAAGGRAFPESRSGWDGGEQMQCADPDGVRIELIARPRG